MNPDDSLFQRFGKAFPRGTVLFREGEAGREMYVVQAGRVRISRGQGAQETVLSTLGPGEFLGEMALLSGRTRSATATCAEDARLLVVDGRTFDAMVRDNGEIAVRLIRALAERLDRADRQIEALLPPDPIQRVALYLAALADRNPGGGALPVALADLPARLALEKEAVHGALQRLARARVVVSRDGGVAVPEPARLREFATWLELQARFAEGA